jgi:hypothetical protein
MRALSLRLALALSACVLSFPSLQAQQLAPAGGTVDVFLDCHAWGCDFDHFRREITWVNWMRDRQDADVHVLVTSQRTGGGGDAFTFAFIGLRDFAGREDTLQYVSDADDTRDEARAGLTQTLKLGLVPFVSATAAGQRLDISYEAPALPAPGAVSDTLDPWNYWVFRIGVGGSSELESQQRFWAGDGSIRANRTTEAFKITLRASYRGSREEFDFTDEDTGQDSTVVSTRTFLGADVLAVWSLTDHWSVGGMAEFDRISVLNWDLAIQAGPALEYNIYPWAESTRRQLTFLYVIGVGAYNYREPTIFMRTSEVHPIHLFEVATEIQQPWGSVDASLEWFQFLHDFDLHSIELDGGVRIRIVRGLDFNFFGSVARIRDQIYLPLEEATPEEVLLQQLERGTEFRAGLHFGLSYRFGSKFNNVVNPRMDGGF